MGKRPFVFLSDFWVNFACGGVISPRRACLARLGNIPLDTKWRLEMKSGLFHCNNFKKGKAGFSRGFGRKRLARGKIGSFYPFVEIGSEICGLSVYGGLSLGVDWGNTAAARFYRQRAFRQARGFALGCGPFVRLGVSR